MSNWPGFEALIKDLERHRDNAGKGQTPFSQGVAEGIAFCLDFLKFEIHRQTLDAKLDEIKGRQQ